MRKDVMIDFETLATTSDAVVLSVGVCLFDRYSVKAPELSDTYLLLFDWASQAKHGRRVSHDTMNWWLGQDVEPRNLALMRDATRPGESLRYLLPWLHDLLDNERVPIENTYFWAKGTNFDLAIMQDVCNSFDLPYPWHYRNTNDCRNLIAEYTALVKAYGFDDFLDHMKELIEEEKQKVNFTAHNPQHDAWLQAYTVWLWTQAVEEFLRPTAPEFNS